MLANFRTTEIREDNFDLAAAVGEIKEPIVRPGEVWQLGRHRLICGDATVLADVEKLMMGN